VAIRCSDASVWSRLKFIDGTRLCVQLSWKCTASPDSRSHPVFGSFTSSDWCPGVCPGVETIVTLPSLKTSWSPASFLIVCVDANAGLLGPAIAQSYSAPWIHTVDVGKSAMLPT